MTAPVVFWMFLNSIAPVVISTGFLTTLRFNEAVHMPHTGGSKGELFIKVSPDRKMIFLRSNVKNIKTNLSVPTVSGKLYSFLLKTGTSPHSVISVKDGKNEKLFRQISITSGVQIDDGDFITRVTNKRNVPMLLNDFVLGVGEAIQLSKGAPVFIDGLRFYK